MNDLIVWTPTVTLLGNPVTVDEDISYAVPIGGDPRVADSLVRARVVWWLRPWVAISWEHTETIEWL